MVGLRSGTKGWTCVNGFQRDRRRPQLDRCSAVDEEARIPASALTCGTPALKRARVSARKTDQPAGMGCSYAGFPDTANTIAEAPPLYFNTTPSLIHTMLHNRLDVRVPSHLSVHNIVEYSHHGTAPARHPERCQSNGVLRTLLFTVYCVCPLLYLLQYR